MAPSPSFNDVFVLYIDSQSGGFGDTSTFSDGTDGLRKAISGFDGGANRSLLTMPSGFLPDYAIALGLPVRTLAVCGSWRVGAITAVTAGDSQIRCSELLFR
jgi:hypothetical protein